MGELTVAIIDDHAVMVDALSIVINSEPGLKVVGTAGNCRAAYDMVHRSCPQVLLLDVDLPDGDGLDMAKDLKSICPSAQVLVLTSLADDRTLMRAIDTGVSGFVAKNRPLVEVISAIRQADQGEIVMPPSLLVGLLNRRYRSNVDNDTGEMWEMLTPREVEILALLARGKSGHAIAEGLCIALTTVRTHIRNILGKLGVHSRLEAVAFAFKHGIIQRPN